MVTIMNFCRLCMSAYSGDTDIFREGEGIYSLQLEEMFQITLAINEEWPSVVCGNCISILDQMKEFKRTILTTQDSLLKMFSAEVKCELPDDEVLKLPDEVFVHHDADTKEEVVKLVQTDPLQEELEERTEPMTEFGESSMDNSLYNAKDDSDKIFLDTSSEEEIEASDEDYTFSRTAPKAKKLSYVERFRSLLNENVPVKTTNHGEDLVELDSLLTELKVLRCKDCSNSFLNVTDLDKHTKRTHKQPPKIFCCSRHFIGIESIYDHMRFHIDPDAFKCPECGKQSKSAFALKYHHQHQHVNTADQFKCEECGKGYKTKNLLTTHYNVKHVGISSFKHECPHCGKRCYQKHKLKKHIVAVHERPLLHVCEICGQGFPIKGYLDQHKRINHENRSPSKCDICGKHYLKLAMHKLLNHSERKMVKCDICDKEYPSHTIRSHKLVHENRSYECNICHKVLKRKFYLNLHMEMHTGIKYQCHFCDHLSTNMLNRTKHEMKKHPQEFLTYRESKQKEITV